MPRGANAFQIAREENRRDERETVYPEGKSLWGQAATLEYHPECECQHSGDEHAQSHVFDSSSVLRSYCTHYHYRFTT